jgi:zinc/manganese transport system substrate-binding protein
LLFALTVILVACSPDDPETSSPGLEVVVTTSILGDVIRNIAGEDVTVEVLVPVGADPHDYQASSQQIASIQSADLVVANGLLLEEGLVDVLENARADGANVLEIAPLLDPVAFDDRDSCDPTAGLETCDPHVWLDPARMADAATLIALQLAELNQSIDWSARAEEYGDELLAADEQIATLLASVPSGNRTVVTNHDAFGFFADRYGLFVVATVFPSGSTLADPSSEWLATLVRVIDEERVGAILAETTLPTVFAEAVAAETGDDVEVVELFIGSLGEPGSGADTLIGMLLTNAERIASALGPVPS